MVILELAKEDAHNHINYNYDFFSQSDLNFNIGYN